MSILRKYTGHFVDHNPEAISEALDDNWAYVVSGKVKIRLEAVERDGEVIKQEFVLYVNESEVYRSKDEEKVINMFMDTI